MPKDMTPDMASESAQDEPVPGSGLPPHSPVPPVALPANRELARELDLPIAEEQPLEERAAGAQVVSLLYGRGTWQQLTPGGDLTLMLDEPVQQGVPVPQSQPVRIDFARTKAHQLGLPFTPDLQDGDIVDGMRVVNALGQVGAYRLQERAAGEEDGRSVFRFEPEASTSDLRSVSESAVLSALAALTRAVIGPEPPSEQDALEAIEKAYDELRAQLCPGLPPRNAFGNDPESPVYYYAPTTWTRNGREAGAWAAGLATRQRFSRIIVLYEHVDGAVTSLVQAGMIVGRESGIRHVPAEDQEGNVSVVTLAVECPAGLAWSF